jgi:cell division septation protein DedD
MSSSRRKFLKAGMLAALFTAAPLKNVLGHGWKDPDRNPGAGSSKVQDDPLANYTKATFISYLNSVFQLRTVAGVVAVTLLKVNDMPAAKGGECFSLLFRGGSRALGQDTYTIDHPALGTFQLLLVPVGTDDNGAEGYLATINRLSYAQAIAMPAPVGSESTERSGSPPPTATTTATPEPANAGPTPTPQRAAPATTPATTKPEEKPKPVRKRKPSWKRTDEDDFDID